VKVAFVFLHPFSGSLGSTVRVRELAISMSKFGVESYIVTPYEKSHTICEGVNVVSIGGAMRKLGLSDYLYRITKFAYYSRFFTNHFMINRNLQMELAKRLATTIVSVLEKLSVDLVQAEQDVALLATIEAKKKTNLPLFADLHNITTEELVATHVIERKSGEFDALQQLFGEALQQTDCVSVVSNEMKDYVVTNYGISPKQVVVVPPGGRPKINEINSKVFSPRVVYAGLVAFREHLDLFVKSMPMVSEKQEDAEFYITRKGRALNKIRRLAKTLGVSPVYFWFPDTEDFYNFLSSCHVGVLPSTNDLARKMGTPVKLFDYFSVGLPVVANDVGTWTNIIKQEKVGIVAEDDPADFASRILELIQNKELAEECGRRGLDLVKNEHNWDNSAKTLLNEYSHL
jgi:glycosyltransferase involved in cell wall biosynthesis